MKQKRNVRIYIDTIMTVMLPVVMAQIITGTKFHEWLGTILIALFILHHIMDRRWFASLFRGKYNARRGMGTAINILMLADVLLLAVSGIARSSYVFNALPQFMAKTTAGKLHISAGWWGFLLMSLHLGVHMRFMTAAIAKKERREDGIKLQKGGVKAISMILKLLAVGIGTAAFIRLQVKDYLLMAAPFAYYTDAERPALYFAEMICMIVAAATVGFEINEIMAKINSKGRM